MLEKRIFALGILAILFIKNSPSECCSEYGDRTGKFKLDPSFAVFDPYVSILDKGNPYRYNVSDLLPLVSKVASNFTRLYIELSEADLTNETSMSLSPLAVATYNELFVHRYCDKLEVWLSFGARELGSSYEVVKSPLYNVPFVELLSYSYAELHKPDQNPLLKRFQAIAHNANKIFMGTVTTLLISYKTISKSLKSVSFLRAGLVGPKPHIKSPFKVDSKFGLILEQDNLYSTSNAGRFVPLLNPDVLVLTLPSVSQSNKEPVKILSSSHQELQQFVDTNIKRKLSLGVKVTMADTGFNGKENISNLVSFWNEITKWSKENNKAAILSQAFDTPYADSVERKTNGLWRLIEDSRYNTSFDYTIEEKTTAIGTESNERKINFAKLRETTNFNKDNVEIIYNLYDLKRSIYKNFSSTEINILLNKVISTFNRLVVVIHDDSELAFRSFLEDCESVVQLNKLVEITLLVSPYAQKFNWNKINYATNTNLKILNTGIIKTYLSPFLGNRTAQEIQDNYYQFVRPEMGIANFGYILNISICTQFTRLSEDEVGNVKEVMADKDAHVIVFYFAEDKETVKLGAERMFRQRVAVMEECRKILSQERNLVKDSIKIKFLMLQYEAPSDLYNSKWAMGNYVQYLQLLNKWAEVTNTTVVLGNAVDGGKSFHNGHHVTEIGWWRYQDIGIEDDKRSFETGSNLWLDKIQDGLWRFPDETGTSPPELMYESSMSRLTNVQIVLVLLGSVVFLIVAFVISLCIIRRRYKEAYLSRAEIDEFFIGRGMNDDASDEYENAPYDKSRYEILPDEFTADFSKILGSGTFGMVCLGSIMKENKTITTAIKMINPQNIHKTTLGGFLSEIKVLAHVGNHDNITTLLGANTSNLQQGKVYIFLEYCELGSLEKYLHKMRPAAVETDEVEMMYEDVIDNEEVTQEISNTDERLQKYLDLVAMTKITLDPSLSDEMFRWSKEICSAMAYLASKHVVHADIATRNVLLDSEKVAKLCDFGLSRRMYNYTNYVKQQQEPLPWKWMSPESLRMMQFNEKSDVWAFGVTLWEIYSLGDKPYAGLSWDLQFADMLEGGLRMAKPKYDDRNVYNIMKDCWCTNPDNRPSFSSLLAEFN